MVIPMVEAKVDEELCIGCGACEEICPEVFWLGEDGKSHVIAQKCDSAGCCEEAAENCPVEAITLE